MSNLYSETIEILWSFKKTIDDITWIGSDCGKFVIPTDDMATVFNVDYDSGFGAQKVASDLVVVGDGWWLERSEYDGSKSWRYCTMPTQQTIKTIMSRAVVREGQVGWCTLEEIAGKS